MKTLKLPNLCKNTRNRKNRIDRFPPPRNHRDMRATLFRCYMPYAVQAQFIEGEQHFVEINREYFDLSEPLKPSKILENEDFHSLGMEPGAQGWHFYIDTSNPWESQQNMWAYYHKLNCWYEFVCNPRKL